MVLLIVSSVQRPISLFKPVVRARVCVVWAYQYNKNPPHYLYNPHIMICKPHTHKNSRVIVQAKPRTRQMESGREPCPYRILDDVGGAFAMGTSIILSTHLTYHSLKIFFSHVVYSMKKTYDEYFEQARSVEPYGMPLRELEIHHQEQEFKEPCFLSRVELPF